MTQQFTRTVVLELLTCGKCGVTFGIEQKMLQELRENGGGFYCPNGHCRTFGESEVDRLTKELGTVRHQKQQAKAALTRLSNRIAFGVCPCCHRHFGNLQRHMATKHPDFLQETDKTAEAQDYVSQEKVLGLPDSELMTTYEAAVFKNCLVMTVRNAIRSKRLPAVMKNNRFYVSRKAVETWKVRDYAGKR